MTVSTVPGWSAVATTKLRDAHSCPVCGDSPLREPACHRCGADLSSPAARALWEASERAAAALAEREHLRRVVPLTVPAGTPRTPRGVPAGTVSGTTRRRCSRSASAAAARSEA
ncbi:MAG: hypothetical protein EOO67_07050, partial [Microbacterium sp.]